MKLRWCGVALMALLSGGLTLAPSALAHSRPVRFEPAPGAVLTALPTEVKGWFSSDIRRDANSFVRVLDAQGNRVDRGETLLSSDRRQMGVALATGLPEGRYLVHWSTLDDDDGDVVTGCYAFFAGIAAAEAAVRGGDPLDGGSRCPAIGNQQPADAREASTGGDGVPLWALALGIAGGLGIGLAGGRFVLAK